MSHDSVRRGTWELPRNEVQRILVHSFPNEPAFVVRRHPSSGRHDLYIAENACGSRLFVKAGTSVRTESWFYTNLDHPSIPAFVIAIDDQILVVEAAPEPMTLEGVKNRSPETALALLANLGTFLAWLHAQPALGAPTASTVESLPQIDPISIDVWLGMSDAGREVVRWLQARPTAADAYRIAMERTGPQALINADIKSDNVLLTETGLMVIDWELSGIGPIGLDLGAAIGSILIAWLEAPARSGEEPRSGLVDEQEFRHQLIYAITRFRTEYRGWDTSTEVADSSDFPLWTAAWLIGRTFAEASRNSNLSSTLRARLEMVEQLIENPGMFFVALPDWIA